MSEIKLSDLTADEKTQFKEETEGDKPGHGILLTGKYHVAAYQPMDDSTTGKCTGVEVFVHNIDTTSKNHIPIIHVPFKQSWLSTKESFKDRLDLAIKSQINNVIEADKRIDDEIARVIKEKKDREDAIAEHTRNVRSCKLKIDSTIKAVAPNSKSLIEYKNEQLLVEKAAEDACRIAIESMRETHEKIIPEVKPIPENNTYESEKEKQAAVNDYILKRETYYEPVCKPVSTKDKNLQPKDFIKEMREAKRSNKVVYAELILPSDPGYMTNLERQNKELSSEKIMG
jgi:hypothetical protein